MKSWPKASPGRTLEGHIPCRILDVLRVKICSDGIVSHKAAHLALGIQADGQCDTLRQSVEQTEGARLLWLKTFNEIKNPGCQDIQVAIVDGLKG